MSLQYISGTPSTTARLQGVVTILVHGGALSSGMYRTFTPFLSTPWIAVDLPGHGKSVELGPFTFARSTELLGNLLKDLRSSEDYKDHKFALVGISLGGQAVLDLVLEHPELVDIAIISGVSVRPPDDQAAWEMPHMPSDQEWVDDMMKDISIVGMDAAGAIQQESFVFNINERPRHEAYPPVLVCIGEKDIAMAKRDFNRLVQVVTDLNQNSEGLQLEGAWHNHSIDIPEHFAELVTTWIERKMNDAEGPAFAQTGA
jgi:pimeloyl-ACP methyl ester carboxylesterase